MNQGNLCICLVVLQMTKGTFFRLFCCTGFACYGSISNLMIYFHKNIYRLTFQSEGCIRDAVICQNLPNVGKNISNSAWMHIVKKSWLGLMKVPSNPSNMDLGKIENRGLTFFLFLYQISFFFLFKEHNQQLLLLQVETGPHFWISK